MSPSDLLRLQHIRVEIERIFLVTKGKTIDDLDLDFVLEHAVTRGLEIIGEASNKISLEFKDAYPGFPWKDMITTGNRISHGYDGIDYEIIYSIVKHELPAVKEKLEKLGLPEIPEQRLANDPTGRSVKKRR